MHVKHVRQRYAQCLTLILIPVKTVPCTFYSVSTSLIVLDCDGCKYALGLKLSHYGLWRQKVRVCERLDPEKSTDISLKITG